MIRFVLLKNKLKNETGNLTIRGRKLSLVNTRAFQILIFFLYFVTDLLLSLLFLLL